MKYSLSPWSMYRNRDGSLNVISAPDDDCGTHKVALVNNQSLANARLIAAAPALLEALKDLNADIWRNLDCALIEGSPIEESSIKASAAIAAATGEPA